MRSGAVSSRGFVIGLSLTLVAPLGAQQPQPPDGVDSQTRYQLRQYETALRQAVTHAGEQLAARALAVVPDVQLSMATEPVVRFVPTPEGPVFDVQIPLLLQTGPALLRAYQRPPAQPVAQNANPDRVTGTGVVTADPMTKSPVQEQVFDPDKEYTAFAREALIDALLDNSGAVPLKDGERLVIDASGLDIVRAPLYPDNSRKLMLVISAADLTAYRQAKITRDEAKARIIERRY
jgi:hypothetical protein